jgi:hypothetical protein
MTLLYPHVSVSHDADILILQGPAQPALFVSQYKLPFWLHRPERLVASQISSPFGLALFEAMAGAGAEFAVLHDNLPPTSKTGEHCFTFTLRTNFKCGFFSSTIVVRNDGLWLRRHGFDLALADDGTLVRPKASLQSGPAMVNARHHAPITAAAITDAKTLLPVVVQALESSKSLY